MLTYSRLSEIAQAASAPLPDNEPYERMRSFVGELLDELSVNGSKIGWLAKMKERESERNDLEHLEALRDTRLYGERLVRATSGLRR